MRFSTIAQWLIILIPFAAVIMFLSFFLGISIPFLGGPSQPARAGNSIGEGGFFQEPLDKPLVFHRTIDNMEYTLTAGYRYNIVAKVVGIKEYSDPGFERIVPVDLAAACGDVIKPEYLQYFTFAMNDRQLSTTVSYPKYVTMLSESYWFEHVSNNHLVFRDQSALNAARQTVAGDCVIIRGYLVDISGHRDNTETYTMKTSISRSDEYPAGCEIVYVESFEKKAC
jgi:hypothetical protein